MKFKGFFVSLGLLLAFPGLYLGWVCFKTGTICFSPTALVDNTIRIQGINPLDKDTTNIIIIHGIGNHCIGYSDPLVSSLIRHLANKDWHGSSTGYTNFLKRKIDLIKFDRSIEGSKSYNSLKLYAPLDGSCEFDLKDEKSINLLKKVLKGPDKSLVDNPSQLQDKNEDKDLIDLEAVVLEQMDLCQSMHEVGETASDVTSKCYRLGVSTSDPPHSLDYTTGFIRQITTTKDRSAKTLNIYEVTWTPSTRWLKKSFSSPEKENANASHYFLNKVIKSQITNNAIADAVIYLSDNGVLINHAILQSFCLTLAGSPKDSSNNDFTCDKKTLISAPDNFSDHNNVFMISHSLGTRILFDSLGLLARGHRNNGKKCLLDIINEKFSKIGLSIPPKYKVPEYAEVLANKSSDFIKSINSIFVLTNQIPLLFANISSPFIRPQDYDVSMGFTDFIDARSNNDHSSASGATTPLQIVTFHDPDDALSYNLTCWYHMNILKNTKQSQDILWKAAENRFITKNIDLKDERPYEVGDEYRTLRETIFSTCSKFESDNQLDEERELLKLVEKEKEKRLKFVDAAVRLNGWKIPKLVAEPEGIHSNYFTDTTIHGWIINGKEGGKDDI